MTTENTAPESVNEEGQAQQPTTPAPSEQSVNWYSDFEGEDLGYIQNKGWDKEDGVKDLFKSYKNLEKLRGVPEDRLLKLPDGEDGWDEVYKKLGKPDSPNDYAFEAKEGMELDQDRVKWFSNTAHELNLNKQQHNKLVEAAYEYETNIVKSIEEKQEQDRVIENNKLKDQWGSAYNERVELGKRAYSAFVKDDSAVDKMEDMLGHASVMSLFAEIGQKISEDNLPTPDGTRQFGYTREQAMSDMQELKTEIKADRERLDQFNKGFGADVEKLARLRKIAYE